MWRPEGWDKVQPKRIHFGGIVGMHDAGWGWCNGFEAGADAMLTALKATQTRLEKHSHSSALVVFHPDGTVTMETSPLHGTLVFIPDEEEKCSKSLMT